MYVCTYVCLSMLFSLFFLPGTCQQRSWSIIYFSRFVLLHMFFFDWEIERMSELDKHSQTVACLTSMWASFCSSYSSSHLAPTTFNINATSAWRRLLKVWNTEDKTEEEKKKQQQPFMNGLHSRACMCVCTKRAAGTLSCSPPLSHLICVYAKSMDPTGRSFSASQEIYARFLFS